MPATRIDIYHKGGFYGDMRAHHRATPPAIYDGPLLWLPKSADNSAGGQVWVPHDRFGFPKGQLLHLSYGRCRLLAVLPHNPPRHTPLEPLLEFDRSEHPFRQAVLTAPIEHEGGVVRVPDGPGLGITVDRSALEQFARRAL